MVNAYFLTTLVGILAVEGVQALAEWLNLRRLDPKLPSGFADLYDAETYRRSQEYTRARTRLGMVSSAYDLAILFAFWFAGGFGWWDRVVRGFGIGPVWTGLIFLVVLFVAQGILDLPFSIYSTFVIEERFGFNRTSVGTFILDVLKGVVVGAVIGLPVLAVFLVLFAYAGGLAWLYAWVAGAIGLFVLQIIIPTVVMPLFNKFTPLAEGELRSAIFAFADRAHFPLKAVYVIDASRRSTKGNAFFTGFGRSKRIALFDTLIERHTPAELVSVLGHEIGHYKKRHILLGTIAGIAEMGLFLGLFSIFVDHQPLFTAFKVAQPSVYAGLLLIGLLLRLLQFGLGVAGEALSRHNERQADSFAANTIGSGKDLASGLLRLSKDSLSNLTPHPFYVFISYSHPPVLERVRRLEAMSTRDPKEVAA
jgi:STE24 endopeptidase